MGRQIRTARASIELDTPNLREVFADVRLSHQRYPHEEDTSVYPTSVSCDSLPLKWKKLISGTAAVSLT